MNNISNVNNELAVRAAYRHCRQVAAAHYENFPVASILLPVALRDPVAAIYAFARRADDLADEGQVSAQQRLSAIDAQAQSLLEAVRTGWSDDPVCLALADACRRHRLPTDLLLDLLSAFRQDVHQTSYPGDAELLDYCRRSANPVGRLLLHLVRCIEPQALAESDALCTALQLLNFLQDLDADYRTRGRLYLPQSDLDRFGLTAENLWHKDEAGAVKALIEDRVALIELLLAQSRPLAARLPGRLRLEIHLTWLAARRLCRRLRRRGARLDDPCRLGWRDKSALLLEALLLPISGRRR